MQSKQKPCALIAARLHGAACAAVGYSTLRSFYFSNFANGSERKGLSAFTRKFPSLTAVFNTSCLRKKIMFSPLSFGRKFSRDNDQRETLVPYCRCEQYSIVLSSKNKLFPRNPFEFLHIREGLVSQSLRLDT